MEFESFGKLFIAFMVIGALVVVGIVVVVLIIYNKSKKEKEKIKTTKPSQRFEYLDCFFYTIDVNHNAEGGSFCTFGYFIIKDIATSKIYAIHNASTNLGLQLFAAITSKEIKIYKGNSKNILNIHDTGTLWINKELNKEFYFRKDNRIKLGRDALEYSGNMQTTGNIGRIGKLYNINQEYDVTLLDTVIFIDGIIEFDNN